MSDGEKIAFVIALALLVAFGGFFTLRDHLANRKQRRKIELQDTVEADLRNEKDWRDNRH